MIKKNHGHIVAISSLAAYFTGPYGTVYCPTKFAVKGNSTTFFTDYRERVGVGVCVCVCGWVGVCKGVSFSFTQL